MALNRTTLSEGGLISALLCASVSNENRYPVTLSMYIFEVTYRSSD